MVAARPVTRAANRPGSSLWPFIILVKSAKAIMLRTLPQTRRLFRGVAFTFTGSPVRGKLPDRVERPTLPALSKPPINTNATATMCVRTKPTNIGHFHRKHRQFFFYCDASRQLHSRCAQLALILKVSTTGARERSRRGLHRARSRATQGAGCHLICLSGVQEQQRLTFSPPGADPLDKNNDTKYTFHSPTHRV